MGYGEFGGGGSVNWLVKHGGSHNPHTDMGTPKRAGGNDSSQGNGKFTVYVNGVKLAEVDIATSRILVVWPTGPQPDDPDDNVPMPIDTGIGHIAR
jgi:hypothetical protein